MITSDKAFLKRVYDKYISIDWKLGQADLNPLREMNLLEALSFNEDTNALREAIKAQVDKTKALLELQGIKSRGILDLDSEDVDFNASNGESRVSNPLLNNQLRAQVGSTGDSLFNINLQNSSFIGVSDLEIEIADLLLTLGPVVETLKAKNPKQLKDRNNAYNFSALPLGPQCLYSNLDDLTTANDNDKDSDKDEESMKDSYLSSFLDLENSANARKEAAAKALEEIKLIAEGQNMELEECVLHSLGILKIFLVIINIIEALKTTIGMVLNVIVPVVEIVTLAAGLWNNPAGAAEIVQKLAQTAFALIVQTITDLLNSLWALLNANCLVKQSLNTLNEIKATLGTGAKAINNIGDAFSLLGEFGAVFNKMVDSFEQERQSSLGDLWDQSGAAISNSFNGAVSSLKGNFENKVDSIAQYFDGSFYADLKSNFNSEFEGMTKAFDEMCDKYDWNEEK